MTDDPHRHHQPSPDASQPSGPGEPHPGNQGSGDPPGDQIVPEAGHGSPAGGAARLPRRVRVLNAIVATAALAAVAIGLLLPVTHPTDLPLTPLARLGIAAALMSVAQLARLRLRVGSGTINVAWGEAALIVGLYLVPAGWLPAAVFAGTGLAVLLISGFSDRRSFGEIAHIAGSLALATTLAAAVTSAIRPAYAAPLVPRSAAAFLAGSLAYLGVTTLLVAFTLALRYRLPFPTLVLRMLQGKLTMFVGNIVVGLSIIGFIEHDARWLVLLPPALWLLQQTYVHRLRADDERRAWHLLAEATGALNKLDERGVARAGVRGALALFGAERVEVDVVRAHDLRRRYGACAAAEPVGTGADAEDGDGDGVNVTEVDVVEPPSASSPAQPRPAARPAALDLGELPGQPRQAGPQRHIAARQLTVGGVAVGELRVHYPPSVTPTPRERMALQTFGEALGAALHDAATHRQLRILEAQSTYDAVHDPLTGLINRSALLAKGDIQLRLLPAEQPVALLLLDVNHFKEVNDTLGHAAGDELLQETARRLRALCQPGEVLARLGGDEFALFVAPGPETGPAPEPDPVAPGGQLTARTPAAPPPVAVAPPAPSVAGMSPAALVPPAPSVAGMSPAAVAPPAPSVAGMSPAAVAPPAPSVAGTSPVAVSPPAPPAVVPAPVAGTSPAALVSPVAGATPAGPAPAAASVTPVVPTPPVVGITPVASKPPDRPGFVDRPAPMAVALRRARQITEELAVPTEVAGVQLSVEASVGVVVASAGAADMTELLRRADIAMYQAKDGGGSVAWYDSARDAASTDRLALLAEIREALAVDDQLVLALQPAVDLTTGAPTGVEALIRWRHPRRGALNPGEFVRAVEGSELLASFTRYVVDKALAAAAEWARQGVPVPISVNISARSLLDPRLPSDVSELLRRHQVTPHRLVLEITETVVMSEMEVIDEVLAGLRATGVQLAVDDFGTGFSSLTFLTRVTVDELKVDRAFVAKMVDSPEAAAIVRTTVELAHSLGLRVVAEGVETADQRAALAALGCTSAQGYHFFRPMPADKVITVLRSLLNGAQARVLPLRADGA